MDTYVDPHDGNQMLYVVTSRQGYYRFRRRVPDNLRAEIGRTEIVISLKTKDKRLVPARYAKVLAQVQALFDDATGKKGISDDILFDAAVRSLTAKRLPTNAPADRDDRSAAEDILIEQGGFGSIDELEEAFEEFEDDLASAPLRLRQLSMEIAIAAGTRTRPKATLAYALRLYLEDKSRGRDTSKKDWVNYERERKRIVSDVTALIGDKELTALTRREARTVLDYLEEGDRYSPGSVKKQMSFLKALVAFAIAELELNTANHFQNLKPAIPHDADEGGVSFTYKEVRQLLANTGNINDNLQDIVRLLACTGARLGEITGLEARDIDLKAKTISLRFNSIRRLKNKKSVRLVPIVDEQALEALETRVNRLANQPATTPLFERYGRDGGSDSASAALGKWLDKLGLKQRGQTTHSLRHTYKDALRETGVHRDIANFIQGQLLRDIQVNR